MRHRVAGRQLSRNSAHRRALRRNMAQSLIEHETISTTIQKAKEIKPFVEKLITLAKKGKLQHRRRAISVLGNRRIIALEDGEPVQKGTVVGKLFSELGPRYLDRPGGYSRIVRLSLRRLGDNGELVLLQLLGKDEPVKKTRKISSKKRARRKAKAAAATAKPAKAEAEAQKPPAETAAEAQQEPREEAAGEQETGRSNTAAVAGRTGAGRREKGMDGCIFCKMVEGEIPVTKVYEDEAVLAFLDIGPISDGHTLVIPKRHCTMVHECDPAVLAEVGARLGRIAGAVMTAMEADGCNVLSNNGAAAWR